MLSLTSIGFTMVLFSGLLSITDEKRYFCRGGGEKLFVSLDNCISQIKKKEKKTVSFQAIIAEVIMAAGLSVALH